MWSRAFTGALASLILTVIPGCGFFKGGNDDSRLRWDPFSQFNDLAELQRQLFVPGELYGELDKELADADAAMGRAREIMLGYQAQGAREGCADGAEGECNVSEGVPPEALQKLEIAKKTYARIVDLFDAEKEGIDYEQLLGEGRCSGNLEPLDRYLCIELLRATRLYDFAVEKFEQYVEEGEIDASLFASYMRLYAAGEGVMTRINSYRNKAVAGLINARRGVVGPVDVATVPYISVIGQPEQILTRVSGLIERFIGQTEAVYNAEVQRKQLRIDELSTGEARMMLRREVEAAKSANAKVLLDDEILRNEEAFLREKLEKTRQQMKNTARKFSLSFQNVMGNVEATPGPRKPLSFNPSKPNIDTYNLGDFKGMIEISVPNARYVSNGIYYRHLPPDVDLRVATSHGWFKGASKKAGGSLKKLGGSIGKSARSVGSWSSMHGGALGKALSQGLMGNVASPVMGAIMNPGGAIVGLRDTLIREIGAPIVGFLFNDLANLGPKAMPPLEMAELITKMEKLDQSLDKVDYPDVGTHVYGQVTDPNGYIIAKSVGRNIGVSEGRGTSDGQSVGGSFFVSASTSQGESHSQGWSAGKSSGLSMQVGFFHPRAKYPQLRVGVVVAELLCDDIVKGAWSVGYGTAIAVYQDLRELPSDMRTGVAGAVCPAPVSRKRLRLITNDADDGRGQVCRTVGGQEEKCTEDVAILASIVEYTSPEATFQVLNEIVGSAEFSERIEDAASSSDPFGTARRFLHQKAGARQIRADMIKAFEPIADHYVSLSMDRRELDRLKLEIDKLSAQLGKNEAERTYQNARLQLLGDSEVNSMKIDDLRRALTSNADAKYDVEKGLADFYLERIAYWIDIYRASALYHQNRVTPDPLRLVRERVYTEIAEQAGAVDPLAASDVQRMLKEKLTLATFINREEETQWTERLLTQKSVEHCMVDFADMLPEGAEDGVKSLFPDSGAVDESALGTIVDRGMLEDSSHPAVSDMLFAGENYQKFYRIKIETDPHRENIVHYDDMASPNTSKALRSRPPLRCGSPTAGTAGLVKLVGVAFSYNSPEPINRQGVFVEHDEMMHAYVDDKAVIRLVDWWSMMVRDQLTSVIRPKRFHEVPLRHAKDTQDCREISGDASWDSNLCYKRMLGGSTLGADAMNPIDFKVNFFNSYVGGTWYLYVPAATSGDVAGAEWVKFREQLKHLRMHLFYAQTGLKG